MISMQPRKLWSKFLTFEYGMTYNQAKVMVVMVFSARLGTYVLSDNRKHNRSLSCVSVMSFSSNVRIGLLFMIMMVLFVGL